MMEACMTPCHTQLIMPDMVLVTEHTKTIWQ